MISAKQNVRFILSRIRIIWKTHMTLLNRSLVNLSSLPTPVTGWKCNEYKLPKPIRDIAEQHHGTTFLHYFYHKALKLAEEKGVEADFTEEDFRYPGPKAQSKEAAVVGIADSVEAAVRSLRKPTVLQVETMIEKIIKSRLDDHQFDECDLTIKELDIIARTLKETVMGIFHSRIEYPEDVRKPKKEEGAPNP